MKYLPIYHKTTTQMAYVGWRDDKGVKDLQRLCDDKHTNVRAALTQVLKKPVYEILFAEDDEDNDFYDFAALVDTELLPKGVIPGLRTLHECQKDKDPKGAIEGNYKAIMTYCPEIDQVLLFKVDKENAQTEEIRCMVEGLGTRVNKNTNKNFAITNDKLDENDERNAERAAQTQNELAETQNELAALREDVKTLTKAVQQSTKKQKALDEASGEPVKAIGVVADFDGVPPKYLEFKNPDLEAETKEEEVQALDETKQEFFSPSKKSPGRLTDARKAPYEPKVAETPLPPLAKALKPVETPASTTSSFGEEGGDVVETPPPIKADPPAPAPVHGAAGRVLGLKKHDPPKGTPVVAQQLDSDKEANAGIPASTLTPGATAVGKENADGAVSKLKAFVTSFGVKTEPGAKA